MKKITNILLTKDYKYLSDYYTELPGRCLLNKGVTGCGGTTVELTSKRNSIILVPNINLIKSKQQAFPNIIPLYGDISDKLFLQILGAAKGYKKIVSTYDGLKRLLWLVKDYADWFLLVDEYHILFNLYSFRNEAIMGILNNYKDFKNYCFMTATPLKEENILDELQDLDIINIDWTWKTKIKLNIKETAYTNKTLVGEIKNCLDADYNLHIFLNSVNTIRQIIKLMPDLDNYRTVCGKESKRKNGQIKAVDITDPVKKINFYTSTAFEGVDIYDKQGKTIIISDTSISTTMFDISTLLVQICGRLRDSIYKDEILFIVNVFNNRYLNLTQEEFNADVEEKIKLAKAKEKAFNEGVEDFRKFEILTFTEDDYNYYINMKHAKLFYDNNLKKVDVNNYYILKIYTSSVSVLKEINNTPDLYSEQISVGIPTPLLKGIKPHIYYTLEDLEPILVPNFEDNKIPFSTRSLNEQLGMYFDKKRRQVDGIRSTYYYFKF